MLLLENSLKSLFNVSLKPEFKIVRMSQANVHTGDQTIHIANQLLMAIALGTDALGWR